MAIKRYKDTNSSTERIIIIGMITSDKFMTKIHSFTKTDYFRSPHTKIVVSWCLEYFEKYKKSPKRIIQDIFEDKKEMIPEGQVEVINHFLADISDEYEREDNFNVDYVYDEAIKYYEISSFILLKNNLQKAILNENVAEAKVYIAEHEKKPVTKSTKWEDPFSEKAIVSTFEKKESNIVMRFHGDLGEMIGDFKRGYLVAIMGKPKIGKTFWLLHCAMIAKLRGFNVLFVSLELTSSQIKERMYTYITGKPADTDISETTIVPVLDCVLNRINNCKISPCQVKPGDLKYSPCTICKGDEKYKFAIHKKEIQTKLLTMPDTLRKIVNIKKMNFSRGGRMNLLTYPGRTLTVAELKNQMKLMEQEEGFIPDMIVTDYADRFHLGRNDQYRLQLKDIWEEHKMLAMEKHCLVITASQTNAARGGNDATRGTFAESQAKEEVIDIGIALNQDDDEEREGIIRASVVDHRHKRFNPSNSVKILSCLTIGRPYLDSYSFKK